MCNACKEYYDEHCPHEDYNDDNWKDINHKLEKDAVLRRIYIAITLRLWGCEI